MTDLQRLQWALALVQGDLDRTMADAPRFRVLVVDEDAGSDYPFTAYVAGPGDAYCGGSSSPLYGPTADFALYSVGEGVQEYLADLDWMVWPVCPRHHHGVHVRPPGMPSDWRYEGGPIAGPPVWWCQGDGGHDLAVVGQLGLRAKRSGSRVKHRSNQRR
jgi:hypothetical protein